MKRIYELCKLLNIKTFADLKKFESYCDLERPTSNMIIAALEREVFQ